MKLSWRYFTGCVVGSAIGGLINTLYMPWQNAAVGMAIAIVVYPLIYLTARKITGATA